MILSLILASAQQQGLGEGVALPAMNNLVATYVPRSAKARALGLAFSGFHSGKSTGGRHLNYDQLMPCQHD